MGEESKKRGRPPFFENPEKMQRKINKYFKDCEGKILTDKDGKPVVSKKGIVYKVKPRPPTVTGLALALGFTSRQALLNYQFKEEFVDTITRARSRIEQYNEEALYSKETCNGAKFNLSNNFTGWTEKQHVTTDGTACGVVLLPSVGEELKPPEGGEDGG